MLNKWAKHKSLKKFADCIIVKGAVRSIIADLTRENYKFISNDLFLLLENYDGKTKELLINDSEITNVETIEDYLKFLEENEYIFWCENDELEFFPPIDLTWQLPSKITNIIIDINEQSEYSINEIVLQLESLNCQGMQIRSYDYMDIFQLERILEYFLVSRIRSIELIIKWNNQIIMEDINSLINKHHRIHSVIFHSADNFEMIQESSNMGLIAKISDRISDIKHCGQIHWNYFNTNIKLFTEAQKHNTCLNRKISIDVNGEIKNCPSMAKSYGNIKDTTLAEAIEKPGFKDLWFINKDQINVCKDCEFRYICTDCRAYIENPEDIYSKPLKCGYNPYTAEWEEWSTNPLKQKAIEYYGMQELVKKQ